MLVLKKLISVVFIFNKVCTNVISFVNVKELFLDKTFVKAYY